MRGSHMPIVAKLDEWGQPAWIMLLIATFFINWMVGLAVLAFLIWSGRMGCRKWRGMHHWHSGGASADHGTWWHPRSSGNTAFDEYRTETLRRLEEEEKEFRDFLTRLRAAKDKAEFDQFMAERRNRGGTQAQPA